MTESESNVQQPGMANMSPEEVASVLEGGFETNRVRHHRWGPAAELAFKFDVELSKKLFAASFDAHVRYFDNQRKPLWGTSDSDWATKGSREQAALALGRILGSTDVRLTQKVRDQGGGDVIAAAREKFLDDRCPSE